jgi:hypothetical protein
MNHGLKKAQQIRVLRGHGDLPRLAEDVDAIRHFSDGLDGRDRVNANLNFTRGKRERDR